MEFQASKTEIAFLIGCVVGFIVAGVVDLSLFLGLVFGFGFFVFLYSWRPVWFRWLEPKTKQQQIDALKAKLEKLEKNVKA